MKKHILYLVLFISFRLVGQQDTLQTCYGDYMSPVDTLGC
jgi:hypothetical protein